MHDYKAIYLAVTILALSAEVWACSYLEQKSGRAEVTIIQSDRIYGYLCENVTKEQLEAISKESLIKSCSPIGCGRPITRKSAKEKALGYQRIIIERMDGPLPPQANPDKVKEIQRELIEGFTPEVIFDDYARSANRNCVTIVGQGIDMSVHYDEDAQQDKDAENLKRFNQSIEDFKYLTEDAGDNPISACSHLTS